MKLWQTSRPLETSNGRKSLVWFESYPEHLSNLLLVLRSLSVVEAETDDFL